VFKSSIWLIRSQVLRSLHLANPISRCGYTDHIWLIRLRVFISPHLDTQISRCGYSRCPGLSTQDLQIWVFRLPHLATQIRGTRISTSGYSRYPGIGTQDRQMCIFRFPDVVAQISISSWTACTLQMGPMGCPQTLVRYYDCTQCKIPKEGRTQTFACVLVPRHIAQMDSNHKNCPTQFLCTSSHFFAKQNKVEVLIPR